MKQKWTTSSYSQGDGNCVEVAETPETVKVRDTRNRGLGHLEFEPQAWTAFLAEVKQGRL